MCLLSFHLLAEHVTSEQGQKMRARRANEMKEGTSTTEQQTSLKSDRDISIKL